MNVIICNTFPLFEPANTNHQLANNGN